MPESLPLSLIFRIRVFFGLLFGLRKHDLRAATTFMRTRYTNDPWTVRLALDSRFTDWTKITPQEVFDRSGMRVQHNAGFSIAAASFHPAKWVWSLLGAALRRPNVQLFTRTKVLRIENKGAHYAVHTTRGIVRARHVINALESYAPMLHRQLRGVVQPTQTQASFGNGGPSGMRPHLGISGSWFFCGRHGDGVMIGSHPRHHQRAGRLLSGVLQPDAVTRPANHNWPKPEN